MPTLSEAELDRLLRQFDERGTEIAMGERHPAWRAHREAETLDDPALVPLLVARLDDQSPRWRQHVLFCLGSIAKNTADRAAVAGLLGHAALERDPHVRGDAIRPLREIDTDLRLPVEPLVSLARDRRWQVRHAALEALRHCAPEEIEGVLLETIASKDDIAVALAAAQLARVETPAVREALERLLEHRNLEVRTTALASLAEQLGPEGLELYRRAAQMPHWQVKHFATEYVARYGAADDVPLIAGRVKQILSRKREVQISPSELEHLLPFLARHRDAPDAEKALAMVRRRWDRLFPEEQRWVAANVTAFRDLAE